MSETASLTVAAMTLSTGVLACACGYAPRFIERFVPENYTLRSRQLIRSLRWVGPAISLCGLLLLAEGGYDFVVHRQKMAHAPAPQFAVMATPVVAPRKPSSKADRIVETLRGKYEFPVKIDDASRLDSVVAVRDDVIRYNMAILQDVEGEEAKSRVIRIMRDQILSTACDNQNFQKVLKDNVSIEIVCAFADGATQPGIVVTPKDCE